MRKSTRIVGKDSTKNVGTSPKGRARKDKGHDGTQITGKPSEVIDASWIFAERKVGKYPRHCERGGKWLIFVPADSIDEVWSRIKLATEQGRLGGASKVATARRNANAMGSNAKVICVYTYDWTDKADVLRIREELRNLGIINKVPYKSDQDTLEGKYKVTGHERISKYFE